MFNVTNQAGAALCLGMLSSSVGCAIDRPGTDDAEKMGQSIQAGAPAASRANDRGVAPAPGKSAADTSLVLRAKLTAADEVPLCGHGSRTAVGLGALGIDAAGTQLTVELQHEGLSGAPTLAHIHFGDPGVAGPVVLNLGTDLSSPIRKVFTAADYKRPDGGPADFAALVAALKAGGTYFNIHTSGCGSGEIRGQIRRDDPTWSDAPSEFQTLLTAADEVPQCSGASHDALGVGALVVSEDKTRVAVAVAHADLSGAPTMAHIHFGDPGTAGPVVLDLGAQLQSPIRKIFSAADYRPAQGAPATFEELVAAIRLGHTYFNIHTAACGKGEIRGQIE
jgi:hypothetical protein